MRGLTVALAATLLAALSPGASASYRGTPVDVADAPWIASLTAFGPGLRPDPKLLGAPGWRSACSAVVIGPRLVLTATHCVDDHDLTRIGVSVGARDLLASAGRVVPIAHAWAANLRGRSAYGHDTALIETTEPLGVPALPLASVRPRPGESVSSFGFGDDRAENRGVVPHPLLRRLDLVVSASCSVARDPDAICTTAPNGGGLRSGDSGGPLVVFRDGSPQLVGDASAVGTDVNVFADVVARRDFLATPPPETLVPGLVAPLRIAGALEPGGRVACDARFSPQPRRVEYTWRVGPLGIGKVRHVPNPTGGRPIPYRNARPPFSHRRAIVLPRDAGGKRVSCSAVAISGPTFRTTIQTVVPRLPRGRVRAGATSYRGVRTALADAPWIASILPLDARLRPAAHPPGHALRCSAAVIGPRLAVTAAHCVDEFDMAHQGVRVGAEDLRGGDGRVVPVRRVWSLQAGRRRLLSNGSDLALIETTRPLGVPALPLASARPRPGETVSSFGFGDDREPFEAPGVPRPFLRRLDSVVQADCADASADGLARPICTRTPDGSGTRQGDSGGPLVVWRDGSPALAGVTSAGGEQGLAVNLYADALASRAFLAHPPAANEAPVVTRPIRIAGDLRPGGRATCGAGFAPTPTRVTYEWSFGPLRERTHLGVFFDARGRRTRYADNRVPQAEERTITLPRGAGGTRVQCVVTAYRGPFFRVVAVAVLPRLAAARATTPA